jgi:hypothetical protein
MDARRAPSRRGAALIPVRIGMVCIALLGMGACATVAPWERETLSHSEMQDEPSPEAARFDAKVAGAHEGALDPGASGGGGCGCN